MKSIVLKAYYFGIKVLPSPFKKFLKRFLRFRKKKTLPYWTRKETHGVEKSLVRIGFVGAGKYAQNHLKVISSLNMVEISSILTRGGSRVHETATKYSIPRVFTDINQFLAQNNIDAFVVVVPIAEAKNVALKCLGKGKPVLLEKPPGLSAADTAELVEQAEKNNTFGMVAMNRRFYSIVEHGLAHLANFGPLRGVILEVPEEISYQRSSKKLSEEVYNHWMVAQSIHGIDLFRYILGDIISVKSFALPNHKAKNAGASFVSILECQGSVTGTIMALWDTLSVWRLKVIAEQGWLEFEPLEKGWFFDGKGKKTAIKPDKVDVEYRMGVYAQDLHFIEAVRSGRKPSLPASLLPDAYKTMQLIEQIIEEQDGNLGVEPSFNDIIDTDGARTV